MWKWPYLSTGIHQTCRIQKNPLWRAVSKICGFGVQIHWLRVDGGQIRIKKYAASKIFVWTGPKGSFICNMHAWPTHLPARINVFIFLSQRTITNSNGQTRQLYAYVVNESRLRFKATSTRIQTFLKQHIFFLGFVGE